MRDLLPVRWPFARRFDHEVQLLHRPELHLKKLRIILAEQHNTRLCIVHKAQYTAGVVVLL